VKKALIMLEDALVDGDVGVFAPLLLAASERNGMSHNRRGDKK
jgi:hypothetical protein